MVSGLWQQIDSALREFFLPIMSYEYVPLDAAKVADAHSKRLAHLKLAEKQEGRWKGKTV
jgi:hypothetical protein